MSIRSLLLIAAIWTLGSSFEVHALASDWPQWLGPTRNGVSTETVAPWTKKPKRVWKRETAGGFSCPVVADGILFVHAGVPKEDGKEQVIAVDALTGKDLWTDTYDRPVYRSQLGSGPRATPSVASGKLITTGISGVISCYKAKTGEKLWRMNPWEDLKIPRPNFGVCASPVIVDGRLIVAVGGEGASIVAYDIETGKEAWKAFDEPAGSASPIVVTRGEGAEKKNEVVAQTTLRLVGLDPKDGAVHWEHPLVFQPSGVSPTSLAAGNLLVCSTQDNGTMTLKIPSESDTTPPALGWWNQDVASYFSTGSLDQKGRVFIVTNQTMPLPRADIRCLDVESGDEKWIQKGLGYFHVGLIVLADGKLMTLDDAGTLILANPGDDKFEELSRASVCGGTFCNPVLSNGYLYTRDAARVSCHNLKDPATGGDDKDEDAKPEPKSEPPKPKPVKPGDDKPDDDVQQNGT